MSKKKCNKDWHVYNDGSDKPCECGKTKSFDDEVDKQISETYD